MLAGEGGCADVLGDVDARALGEPAVSLAWWGGPPQADSASATASWGSLAASGMLARWCCFAATRRAREGKGVLL